MAVIDKSVKFGYGNKMVDGKMLTEAKKHNSYFLSDHPIDPHPIFAAYVQKLFLKEF